MPLESQCSQPCHGQHWHGDNDCTIMTTLAWFPKAIQSYNDIEVHHQVTRLAESFYRLRLVIAYPLSL